MSEHLTNEWTCVTMNWEPDEAEVTVGQWTAWLNEHVGAAYVDWHIKFDSGPRDTFEPNYIIRFARASDATRFLLTWQ